MKQVTIKEGIFRSAIIGPFPFKKLCDHLSFRPKGYAFSPKFRLNQWDGYTHLLTPRRTIPSGLVQRTKRFLEDIDIQVTIEKQYETTRNKKGDMGLRTSKLRDYQIDGVNTIIGQQRGVFKLPTGAGKTLIAAACIRKIARPTVFLSHRKDILYNAEKVFKKEINPDIIGFIGDNRHQPNIVDIASIPTLYKNWKRYKKHMTTKHVLIVDEVHHASANTWYKVIQRIPAPWRIGLTATPDIGPNALKLEGCIGEIIFSISPQRLIKEGYLSEPTIYMLNIDEPKLPEKWEYQIVYRRGIVTNEYRNQVIAETCKYLIEKDLTPIVVLFKRLDQGRTILRRLKELNLNALLLTGMHKASKRTKAIDALESGELKIAVASTIFDEGIDVPSMKVLFLTGGDYGQVKTIQRLGRSMRATKDKKEVMVLDLYDATHDYLERHSKRRRTTFKKQGYKVVLTTPYKFKKEF